MPTPGDVVIVDFPGASGTKRRPAVIVSSSVYHGERPDVIVGATTSNVRAAGKSTGHVLLDRQGAGLRSPSAFRSYLFTTVPSATHSIGKLSAQDWGVVRGCVLRALG